MNMQKTMLEAGIQFAIDTNYDIHNRAKEVRSKLYSHKNVCIFGTGNMFRGCANEEFVQRFEYVSDNDSSKWGKVYNGRVCVCPDELHKLDDIAVLIMMGDWKSVYDQFNHSQQGEKIEAYPMEWYVHNMYDEHYSCEWFNSRKGVILDTLNCFEDDESRDVYVQLILNRIAPQRAAKSYLELQTEGQYFNEDVLQFHKNESFVDAGAYIGDTMQEFIDFTGGVYDNIYCFELSSNIFDKLKKNAEVYQDQRIHLYQAGVGEKEEVIEYAYSGGPQRQLEKIVALDDVLADKPITFIKMDVECFETSALKGSKKILKEQEPKLAICAYHKLSDLWEIPRIIKKINPGYKVFLRHHSPVVWDTVCYAY